MTDERFAARKTNMDETKLRTRDDIPDADKWDLSHLFISADKWSDDFAWIETTYPRLTTWKGRVGESAPTLAELLEFDKTLDLKIERVYHYASLQLAEDSSNPDYLARMGQLQNLLTQIGEAASFITPEIQAIKDDNPDLYKRIKARVKVGQFVPVGCPVCANPNVFSRRLGAKILLRRRRPNVL
jgi:oligoendopeptidase F